LTAPQDSHADAEVQQATRGPYASWNRRAALGLKSRGGIPAPEGAGGGQGTGIAVDERETVFEPGHSGMNGGTRLGQAIVEQITAAHDWNVPLTTADCGGARFEIRF
jgi:hypothetical protein